MDKILKKLDYYNLWNKAYLIILGLYVLINVLDTTMFEINWPEKMGYVLYAIVGGYAIAKMICFVYLKRYRAWELIFSFIIIGTFTIPAVFTTSYSYLFGIAFLIVGAKDVDFDDILKVYMIVTAAVLICAVVASQTGLIVNLQYEDPNKGIRNSMGTIYPTDFGAHIFYLAVAWVCYRNKALTWLEIGIISAVTIVVYVISAPVTSAACTFIMLFMCIWDKLADKTGSPMIVSKAEDIVCRIGQFAVGIFAAGYLLMQHLYDPLNIYWSEFDYKISLRLYYTYQILEKYSIRLFGQDIEEKGFGRDPDMTHDYLFLDDSYMAIALKYGIVILAVVIIMFAAGQYMAYRSNRLIIVLAGIVIALHCFMEHHLIEAAYNPFMLLIFAKIGAYTYKERKHKL